MGDHRVGGFENGGGGTVVLLEDHDFGVGVVLLEVEDVADVGPPPPVYGLVAVTHHAQVAMSRGELLDEHVLGVVGVLVFVDQDVGETLLVVGQHVVEGAEQLDGDHQQVVEVHRRRRQETLLVEAVDVGHLPLVEAVGLLRVGLVVDQLVLGSRDRSLHRPGREPFRIEVEVPDAAGDQTDRIGLVVDREPRPVAETVGFPSQDPHARRMEGGHPHGVDRPTHQPLHPVPHLVGCLVGEGDGQYPGRVDPPVSDEVGDPVSEDPGLARPGAGHHQHGAVPGHDRLDLGGVETVEELRGDGRVVRQPGGAFLHPADPTG
ncbi:MAG: hypothetical protein KatS3mg011_0373 [Acidimicrobiia bacterium]|nr:MAG: hypothetical protein KatS3mg011_0373 [Acidimicrobiia bacterium]